MSSKDPYVSQPPRVMGMLVPWQRFFAQPILPLIMVSGLALALRLFRLDYHDYWDDEMITAFAIRPPVSEIFGSINVFSVHPPLYYILLKGWAVLFGDDLFTLRLFSVVVSVACLPLCYMLGRRLVGHWVGLLGSLLLAINPFLIFHSQQARMYPLLALVVLITTLIYLRAWEEQQRWQWVILALSIAVGLYIHIYFIFSLFALNLWSVWRSWTERNIDRQRWLALILAQGVGGLAFVPFLPQLTNTVGNVVQSFWVRPPSPFDMLSLPIMLSNGSNLLLGRADLWLVLALLPAIAAMLLAHRHALLSIRHAPTQRNAWMMLLALLWVPSLTAGIISLLVRPILVDRMLIAGLVPIGLILAWAAYTQRQSAVTQATALAFLLSNLLVLGLIYPSTPRTSIMRETATMLLAEYQPGDAIAFAEWQPFLMTTLIAPDQPSVYVMPVVAPTAPASQNRQAWLNRAHFMGLYEPVRIKTISELAPDYARVWVVLTVYNPVLDFHRTETLAWLEQNAEELDRIDRGHTVILLYAMPKSEPLR